EAAGFGIKICTNCDFLAGWISRRKRGFNGGNCRRSDGVLSIRNGFLMLMGHSGCTRTRSAALGCLRRCGGGPIKARRYRSVVCGFLASHELLYFLRECFPV